MNGKWEMGNTVDDCLKQSIISHFPFAISIIFFYATNPSSAIKHSTAVTM